MMKIDYKGLILRRMWLIAGSVVLVIGAVCVHMFSMDPVYESHCKILLVDDQSKGMVQDFTPEDFMMQTLGKSDPIKTQIEMLKTRPVMEEVIERCDIRGETGRLVSWEKVRKRFHFEHVKLTNIVKIYCRDECRERAAMHSNTLAQVFMEQNQFLNQEEVRNVKRFLENQLIVQKKKVEEAEKLVIDFKTGSKTVSLGEQTSMRVTALGELEAEKVKLESELKGLEAQNSEIERRLNTAGSQTAPGYSSLISAKDQIGISMMNLFARLRAVNIQINLQYQNMKDIPPLEIQLAKLEREEKMMNQIYTNLLSKYEEYKIREAARVGSIKIIEPAVASEYPAQPKKKRGVGLAGFAGLLLGFGIALTLEYIKDRPYSVDEIKKILKVPSLGAVPFLHKEKPLFMRDNPRSAPAEAIRLIHTNLKFRNVFGRERLALLVTSAQPGDGKSLITANLALAFSIIGKKTALVSLDLRSPSFNRLFSRKFVKGVTDYLIGEASLSGVMWNCDSIPNLTVISGGSIPPNPTEISVSPKMNTFIEQIKSSFDVVLFDTAPITLVAETLEVTRKMDGIVLVADHSESSRKRLSLMQEMIEGKKLPVLGFVVNKVGKELGGRYSMYGYAYRKYVSGSKKRERFS